MDFSMPGLPVHHQLPESTQTHVHWVSDAIQPSHPLSSPSPPAFNLSHRVFSNGSVLHIRWPKHWSFSISPTNEYSRLISFRMDWFDLLAVLHGYPLFGGLPLFTLYFAWAHLPAASQEGKQGRSFFFFFKYSHVWKIFYYFSYNFLIFVFMSLLLVWY